MTTDPRIARYRHRTTEIEAVQWTGTNADALRAFAGADFDEIELDGRVDDPDETAAVREADHGTWRGLKPGDWVVKLEGGLYEFSAADFASQYEAVSSAVAQSAPAKTALRDRIAEALRESCMTEDEAVGPMADAVLAVLPQSVDRAVVYREVADRLAADAERGEKEGFTRIYQRAAVLREAADDLLTSDLGPRPGHTEDYGNGWSDATLRAQSRLWMLADRAGSPAPTYRVPLADLTGDELEALYAERDMLRRNMQRAQTDLAVRDAALAVQAKRIARVVAAASVRLAEDECGESECRGYHSALSDVRRALDGELRRMADETQPAEARCGCPHPEGEHSVYGCADGCGCEWMPKRPPMDPVHILGIEAPRCDVEFEGGGRCTKAAGHWTPQNQDPHTPPAVGA